jgi:hypothetical protein
VSLAVSSEPEHELNELYARYKALALAAGAALILDSDVERLAGEVKALLDDARRARRGSSALAPQLSACVEAAAGLGRLLADAPASTAALEAARASHRRLRREVWNVLPCEYVPCCAGGDAHHER